MYTTQQSRYGGLNDERNDHERHPIARHAETVQTHVAHARRVGVRPAERTMNMQESRYEPVRIGPETYEIRDRRTGWYVKTTSGERLVIEAASAYDAWRAFKGQSR